jgi:parallel beta-helix repeat protein
MADKTIETTLRKDDSSIISYDAIVASDGTGNYDSIKQALDSGAKNIFVRKGTYYLNSNLVIKSNTSITGEDKYSTIIDLNGEYGVVFIGTDNYSGGYIDTIVDTVVTGSGTAWLANVEVGYHIIINNVPYLITAINSDTELEISVDYGGSGSSSNKFIDYLIADFKTNIQITNLTFSGQRFETGVHYVFHGRYFINSYFDNIIITDNESALTVGFYSLYSFNNVFSNINTSKNGYFGFDLTYSNNNILQNIDASNSTFFGIRILRSHYNKVSNCVANNCMLSSFGLSFSNYNIINNISSTCSKGIYLYDSTHNSITNCSLYNTIVDEGINIEAGSDHNVISNNVIFDAGSDGIEINNSHYNIISNNVIQESSHSGISINNASNNIISSNSLYLNATLYSTQREIFIENDSTYNNIVGNRCVGTRAYVIAEETTGDDYNLITSNIVSGGTTANINILGVNSIKANNIE